MAPEGEMPNDHEKLFLAFLTCANAVGRVEELKTWAAAVFRIGKETAHCMPDSAEWRMVGSTPGAMLKPLCDAFRGRRWAVRNRRPGPTSR